MTSFNILNVNEAAVGQRNKAMRLAEARAASV